MSTITRFTTVWLLLQSNTSFTLRHDLWRSQTLLFIGGCVPTKLPKSRLKTIFKDVQALMCFCCRRLYCQRLCSEGWLRWGRVSQAGLHRRHRHGGDRGAGKARVEVPSAVGDRDV